MAPKYHHPPLSGGDRKALTKEIAKSRAMTTVFATRSADLREQGEALIREADNLACQSWNERMWSDGGPVDPSPTVDQAVNGGFPWLEIACSRCRAKRDVDLAALRHVSTTCVHDLASRLVCQKCKAAGKRPPATLLQLLPRARHQSETNEMATKVLRVHGDIELLEGTQSERLYQVSLPKCLHASRHLIALLALTARGDPIGA